MFNLPLNIHRRACTRPNTPVSKEGGYILPDFLATCPFPLKTNPHYKQHAKKSYEWLDSFDVHPDAKHRDRFHSMDCALLVAFCYPEASAERYRILCDFMGALFSFDDLTDEGSLREDSEGTRRANEIVLGVLRDPRGYQTKFKVAHVMADWWSRAIDLGTSPGHIRRFIRYMDTFCQAILAQVVNRTKQQVLDIESFIKLRRDTGAVRPCFAMAEFALALDLPDEVMDSSVVKRLENAANDVIVLSNDIYSYNIEQAQGDPGNIITAIMRQHHCDLQTAVDFAGDLCSKRVDLYVQTKRHLPSYGERVDKELGSYLTMLEDWMVANYEWSFQSTRYFGDRGPEFRMTLWVPLLPKQQPRGLTTIPGLKE